MGWHCCFIISGRNCGQLYDLSAGSGSAAGLKRGQTGGGKGWRNHCPLNRKTKRERLASFFYPGAFVSPEAYAPLALEIAEQGYPVYIVRMPMNLAVLSPERGSEIMALHPEIENWAVGGHSLGGAMAPELAKTHNKVKGIFFSGRLSGG